jgi:hypothetical protein
VSCRVVSCWACVLHQVLHLYQPPSLSSRRVGVAGTAPTSSSLSLLYQPPPPKKVGTTPAASLTQVTPLMGG